MREGSALPWLGLSGGIVVADQTSKWVAVDHLQLFESVAVLPGLNWTLLYNYGAAFSFLNTPDGWQRWLFTGLAAVICILLTVWLARTTRSDWRNAVPLALIIGGALGNAIDRVRLGYVVDFIDVYVKTYHWPAFNVADSAISVGAVLLIALGLFDGHQRKSAATD